MTAPANRLVSLDRQLRLPFHGDGLATHVTFRPVPGPGHEPLAPVPPIPPPTSPAPVVFVRHPRARRYVLRVQPDGVVRVTIPRAGSRKDGEVFLRRNLGWVERQRAALQRLGTTGPLEDGDTVLLGGLATRVSVVSTGSRVTVRVGDLTAAGAHPTTARVLAARALRAFAERDLPPRLRALAKAHALSPTRVTVRNQKGRWGSCSATGSISLNWRLVQMPPEVRDYVLLHELMHMHEPNHSRRFWRHVARVCPWHLRARRWLARMGKTLL